MKRVFTILTAGLLASACAQSTGDDLIDKVMTRVDPFGDCLYVVDKMYISEPTDDGSPMAVTPDRFEDVGVREAAGAVAGPRDENPVAIERELFGEPGEYGCGTYVSKPLYSGHYAFVSYSASGGSIGVYAFHKNRVGWSAAEHLFLGWW